MKYLGGKFRTANEISNYLNSIIQPRQPYWEPFVGAAWVLRQIRAKTKFASDVNPYLIAMWNAAINGWRPPENVSEEEYNDIKENKDKYPPELVAFVGFATSFGGKWFGGYARNADPQRNYAREGSRSVRKGAAFVTGTEFFVADFIEQPPPKNKMLIYCDPPYLGATQYDYAPSFDHEEFWNRVRFLHEQGHTVIVSEYTAPDDFSTVLEIVTKTDMHTQGGKDGRIERLFALTKPEENIKQLKMF